MSAILLDSCVWGGCVAALKEWNYDVIWCGSWSQDPGDAAILETAYATRRILVTLDKDFGELAILKGMPHSGIIRLRGFRVGKMASVIHHLVSTYDKELKAGAIISAAPDRIIIRSQE